MAQLVFVDLETTGLDVDRHGIIEIGCISRPMVNAKLKIFTP